MPRSGESLIPARRGGGRRPRSRTERRVLAADIGWRPRRRGPDRVAQRVPVHDRRHGTTRVRWGAPGNQVRNVDARIDGGPDLPGGRRWRTRMGHAGTFGGEHHAQLFVYDRLLGLPEIDCTTRNLKLRAEQQARSVETARDLEAGRVMGTRPSHEIAAYAGRYKHPSSPTAPTSSSGAPVPVPASRPRPSAAPRVLPRLPLRVPEIRKQSTFHALQEVARSRSMP